MTGEYHSKIHLRARSLQGAAGRDAHRQPVAAVQGRSTIHSFPAQVNLSYVELLTNNFHGGST